MHNRFHCLSILVAALIIILCSCESTSIPLSNDYKKVEPLKDYKVYSVMYVDISEEDQISYSDLIFKGRVLDTSEYLVNDKYSSCVGIIKYRITDIIYSIDEGIQKGDDINIFTANTSRLWASDAINQKVNSEYIILVRKDAFKDERDPYRYFSAIAQYYLPNPFTCVITITDEGAEFNEMFSTLVPQARTSKRLSMKDFLVDCYEMNEDDFVTELKKLIELYKRPKATSTPAETN